MIAECQLEIIANRNRHNHLTDFTKEKGEKEDTKPH